jgi:LmbE family N-acetylglucosaminyl deacetylase
MGHLTLGTQSPSILCLGAHSDDIEIGAGATLLQLLDDLPETSVHWRVFSASGDRQAEARRSASLFAGDRLASIEVFDFQDGFFPDAFREIKQQFRELASTIDPDVILTHWREDLHQDHRLISEVTAQTFRKNLIFQYEILKYDGGLGSPNVYIPIDAANADQKVNHLLEAFASQLDKYWFTAETFQALMRVRGVECRAASGFAEAFYGEKLTIEPGHRDG